MIGTSLPWKHICLLLSGIIITQFLFYHRNDISLRVPFPVQQIQPYDSSNSISSGSLIPWDQLPRGEDGEIIDNLSSAQCDYAFPDLYHEIERTRAYWLERKHTITEDDVSIAWKNYGGDRKIKDWGGAMRLLIHDNHLRIVEAMGLFNTPWKFRAANALLLIHRAIESATAAGETLPTIEFPVTVSDITWIHGGEEGTSTTWTWTRHIGNTTHDRYWLMPNFDMYAGTGNISYRDSVIAARQQDAPFKEKIQKIVWRGTAWVNMPLRQKMLNVGEGKPWSDLEKLDGGHKENYLENDELCKYAMTVHTEGASYSGRMKWLAACNSLMFFHEREWEMYYYHLLQPSGPQQNYVPVKNDWSDLEEKVTYYLDHPDEAERIIANFVATFRDRYLTRAAVSCYTRKLIKSYAEVTFTPRLKRSAPDDMRIMRGFPFEHEIVGLRDFGGPDS